MRGVGRISKLAEDFAVATGMLADGGGGHEITLWAIYHGKR